MSTSVGTTTTYFIGAHYEVTGSGITKYYFAGTQRIAIPQGDDVRKDGTLYYLLGDHLGSTSIVTDAAGNVVSQTKYRAASLWDKAWGEVRYSSGTSPTDYTYTGQYSHTSDFGLMFFNARWLDVSLGRFAQADTIIPPGVQGLDRYGYVNNSPMNYVDPSGHAACDENGNCREGNKQLTQKIRIEDWQRKNNKRLTWLKPDDVISEGTIYTSTNTIPQSQAEDSNLSSKSEESYGIPEQIKAEMPYLYDLLDAISGLSSDFYSDFDIFPIGLEINWQHRETGLYIQGIDLKNHSPNTVMIKNVVFYTNVDSTVYTGPNVAVGINGEDPGVLSMDLNYSPSKYLDTTMEIHMKIMPGAPRNPPLIIFWPARVNPLPGCNVLR